MRADRESEFSAKSATNPTPHPVDPPSETRARMRMPKEAKRGEPIQIARLNSLLRRSKRR